MNNVVPVSRDEYKGLRDLCRQWESHALSAESEVTALRSQYRRALQLMRFAVAAHEANDPVALGLIVEKMGEVAMAE